MRGSIRSLSVLVALAASFACSGDQIIVYNSHGFEPSVFSVGPLNGQHGWTTTNAPPPPGAMGSVVAGPQNPALGQHALRFDAAASNTDGGTDATWFHGFEDDNTDEPGYNAERSDLPLIEAGFKLYLEPTTESTQPRFELIFQGGHPMHDVISGLAVEPDLGLHITDDAGGFRAVGFTFDTGAWHDVTLRMNFFTGITELAVDDVLHASDFLRPNSHKVILGMRKTLQLDGNDLGGLLIDDLQVRAIPAPGTLALALPGLCVLRVRHRR